MIHSTYLMTGKPKYSETIGVIIRDPEGKIFKELKEQIVKKKVVLIKGKIKKEI